MRLKSEDAGLFYELFLPLLDYVNENYHVIEEPIRFTGESVDPRDAAEVAHFFRERTWIIDDYLTRSDLPEECQNILSSWKRCISGTFIIERHLKKHYPQLKPIKDLTFCCDEIWTFLDSHILGFYRHPDEWEQQIFGSQ